MIRRRELRCRFASWQRAFHEIIETLDATWLLHASEGRWLGRPRYFVAADRGSRGAAISNPSVAGLNAALSVRNLDRTRMAGSGDR